MKIFCIDSGSDKKMICIERANAVHIENDKLLLSQDGANVSKEIDIQNIDIIKVER